MFRLPCNVKPKHYDLSIKPDFENNSFSGQATVTMDIKSPVGALTCHAFNLKISLSFSKLTGENGEEEVPTIMMNPEQETVQFIFNSLLSPGLASLTINYTGCLFKAKCAAGAARKV